MALQQFRSFGPSRSDRVGAARVQHHANVFSLMNLVASGRGLLKRRGNDDPSALEAALAATEQRGGQLPAEAVEYLQKLEHDRELMRRGGREDSPDRREDIREDVQAEAVPDEARGSILSRLRRGGGDAETLDRDVELRVGDAQLARWKQRADKEGIPVSRLLRRTMDEALALYDATEQHSEQRRREELDE